jgi:hypothetical protein
MEQLLHHPETHRLGKADPKAPHMAFHELVDMEKLGATITVPANIINSSTTDGGPAEAIQLGMHLNDTRGCCTVAGIADEVQVSTNGETNPPDEEVETGYEAITGQEGAAYSPGPPAVNDNGCAEVDVLDYYSKNPMSGLEIVAHASVNMFNPVERRMALYLTGSLYPGWQLSTDQQSQPIWQKATAPAGSWGGHCAVIFDDYTEIPAGLVIGGVPIDQSLEAVFAVGTWAQYKPCLAATANGFIRFACDEGHALFLPSTVQKLQAWGVINEQALQAWITSNLTPEK